MKLNKILVLLALASGLVLFFIFDLNQYFSLDYITSQKQAIAEYQEAHPLKTGLLYFAIYVVVTALSLPAAAIVTLAGGAIFGVIYGTVLVSFASTIGATLAFLMARTLLRDTVERRFSQTLESINKGVEREGAFYLFGLRLVPIFPFFAVNLLMGLTSMKTWRFFVVSQLGMLPGTIVYVNAGTQLAQLESLADISSPGLILSFALLGIFPLIAKKMLDFSKAKKVYQGFDKPKHFDTNLVAIGGGSAGLVSAYIAAATKAKVTLIEKHLMGGDCLNTGCVPSKALIRSAKIASYFERANEFGLRAKGVDIDFNAVMERVKAVVSKVEPHDSVERYTGLGVDCEIGEARVLDPFRVQVNGKVITTRNIVIATGARPSIPNIEGIGDVPYFTSDTIWELRERPENMIVLGSGPIGCELAQSFNRLGVKVTLVNRSNRLMAKEDLDVSDRVRAQLEKEGMQLKLGCAPVRFTSENGVHKLYVQEGDTERALPFDCLLLAVGRSPNTKGFGLEDLDIASNENGTIQVNEYLQTKYPNIYACGDVAGPYQFTHAAAHQAWYAAVNALFGSFKRFKVDYHVIPWATFTDPEVARVGLNEQEAQARGISYEITRYGIDDLDRAIADGEDHGEVKVLTVPGKDKILGVTIVGHHSGELITEFVTAMKHGFGLNKILGTIHIYPTLSEANKYAAGEWKRNNVPGIANTLLPRFHRWQRGGKL